MVAVEQSVLKIQNVRPSQGSFIKILLWHFQLVKKTEAINEIGLAATEITGRKRTVIFALIIFHVHPALPIPFSV